MTFSEEPPYHERVLKHWASNNKRIRFAILDYAFGQNRIQVIFDRTCDLPVEHTDIVLQL
jgi:hypothetical protein